MKRILAALLVLVMVFAFAACGNDQEESKPSDSSSTASTESKADDKSEAASKEESEPAQSEDESSEEPAEESSESPAIELPDFSPAFVYVAGQNYDMKPTDSASIRITKINPEEIEFGDVACFTPEFGDSIAIEGEDYADYAIFVVEYDKDTFSYLKKQIINVEDTDDKSNIAIPEDGFVLAIHKEQKAALSAIKQVKDDVEIYPSNFQPKDFQYTVKKTDTEFDIDGVIGKEWDDFLVDEISETNLNWDYRQFEKNKYEITANVFMAYNEKGAYLAVVVNAVDPTWMPGISDDNASGMWKYTCIQVNTLDQSPLSEYMIKHAQYGYDKLAVTENHLRQYGFSGSDSGESYAHIWMGESDPEDDKGLKYACTLDSDEQVVTYEVFFPWAEINVEPEEVESGFQFSISVSINSSSDTSSWKNIRARNGGGIIGMNEFTKMPVITIE